MKKIIVDVKDLTIKDKQLVNEVLAKIANVSKIEKVITDMEWFYAPSCSGLHVGWDRCYKKYTPTHTPLQVLEMAGMLMQGHIHAEHMAQYAEDAKAHAEPWKLWECRAPNGKWAPVGTCLHWVPSVEYRRKPKTHLVHGVEIPDLRFTPKFGENYWQPDAGTHNLVLRGFFNGNYTKDYFHSHRIANNLCYEPNEEGKQAAILHAKAWLGVI